MLRTFSKYLALDGNMRASRTPSTGRFKSLFAMALGATTVACTFTNGGFAGGGSQGKSSAQKDAGSVQPANAVAAADESNISKDRLAQNFAVIQSIGFFEGFARLSTADYFAARIAAATNDTYEIDGYRFAGVKDLLLRYEAQAQALALDYPTMGDYYASLGIYSAADLRLENAETNLARMEALVASGRVGESDNAPQDSIGDATADFGSNTSTLFALERPLCDRDHTWDIPVYAEHCHEERWPVGSHTCTPAVYREHGHRCDDCWPNCDGVLKGTTPVGR